MSARVKIVCEKRNRSVLTHSQVVDIFSQRPRSGPTGLTNVRMYTPTELSVFYHVSPKAIRDIWNGRFATAIPKATPTVAQLPTPF